MASTTTDQDVVWVDVLPSMDKLVPSLRRALPSAGKQAGEMFGQSLSDAASSKVDAASGKMAAALKKVQDAAGQTAVAEAKLQALRDKEVTDAGRVAAAEEAVAKARRNEIAANEGLSAATRGVAAAQDQLATAERLSAAAGDQATKQVGQLARAQGQATQSTTLLGRAHQAISGTISAAGAIASRAWFPVTATLAAAGGVGLKTASNMEQAQIAFTNMLGSGQKAQAFLQQLSAFAAKTPFEFQDVTRASQRLMAMGIQSKDVLPYLTAIGDSVAALGGGAEQIDQVTTAIGQMQAKGKIQSDEVLQLTETGIPALQILANSYGVTNGQMQDMITKGQVLSTDALPKLIAGLENGTKTTQAFGGMMSQQSQSLSGLWSTVKDTVTMDLSQMWTPLIPSLKSAMDKATPIVGSFLSGIGKWTGNVITQVHNLHDAFFVDFDAQGVGEVLDNIFGNTGRFVGVFSSAAQAVLDFWAGLTIHRGDPVTGDIDGLVKVGYDVRLVFLDLVSMWQQVGPVLNVGLTGAVRLAWQAFQLLLPAVTGVLDFLSSHQAVLWTVVGAWTALTLATKAHAAALAVEAAGGLVEWIRQVNIVQGVTKAWAAVQWVLNTAMEANPIILITTALIALGAAIYEAWQHSQTFRDIVTGAWHAVGDAAQVVWTSVVKPVIDGLVAGWQAVTGAIAWGWSTVIEPTWAAVGAAAQWLWGNVLHPVFDGISAAWQSVADGIVWGWDNIMHPVLTVIGDIFTVIGRIIIVLVLLPIELAWQGMTAAIKWGWENVLQPTWNAVASAAQWLWTTVLQPVWAAMQAAWNGLLADIQWAWINLLQPTWLAIQAAAQWLWLNVLMPVWGAMQAGWNALLAGIQSAWANVLLPTWNAIQGAAQWLWGTILQPIFGAIGTAWDGLVRGMRWVHDNVLAPMWTIITDAIGAVQRAFEAVVKGIGDAWNTMMDVVATPINFVMEVVFNRGLFTAWNWAINSLGLPGDWKAPHWDQLPRGQHFAAGGELPGYAAGGPIPGPYLGPTADNVLGLVGGRTPVRLNPREWIIPVGPSEQLGPQRMEAIRSGRISREGLDMAMAITGRGPGFASGGQIPRFDDGGVVPGAMTWPDLDSIRKQMFPGSVLTSAYRPGANDYHGRGDAIDIGWPGNDYGHLFQIAAALTKAFPYSTELIHDPNGSIKNGQPVSPGFWGTDTWLEHLNHVHWAMTPDALAKGGGPGTASIGSAFANVGDVLSHLTGAITGPVSDFVSRFGSSGFAGWVGKLPGALLGRMWDGAKDKIGQLFTSIASAVNPANSDYAVSSTGPVQDQVKSAFHAFHPGWEAGPEWAAVDYVVSHESSWDPAARNPSSSASGLFQMIDSTWRAYRGPNDGQWSRAYLAPPGVQAMAGANYMDSRFGDPIGAANYWKAHGNYAHGGQVLGFANGGIVPNFGGGVDSVPVMATPDERVQTAPQDGYTRRLVTAALAAERAAAGGSLIDQVTLQVRDNDSLYAAFDELEHRMTVAAMGGRYARVTTP